MAIDGPAPEPVTDPAEHRQRILNRLMMLALEGVELPDLARECAERVAEGLGVELACVMRLVPEGDRLLLSTGVGWDEGCVGRATVDVGMASRVGYVSQAGYTLIAEEPVAVSDLELEPRFEGSPLLECHRVRAGVTARISAASGPDGTRPYGLVGAHSREPRAFSSEEAEWVGDVAWVLGAAATRHAGGVAEAQHLREVGQRYETLHDVLNLVASAPDPLSALDAVASVAVGDLADWCIVDLLDDHYGLPGFTGGDAIRRVVVRSAPGAAGGEALADELARRYPLDPRAPGGTPKVLRRQKPVVETRVTDAHLRGAGGGTDHLDALRPLEPTSYIGLPLMVRAKTRGAILLVTTGGRRLDHGHLPSAEGLAACASLALCGFPSGVSPERDGEEIGRIARSGTAVALPGSGPASAPDPPHAVDGGSKGGTAGSHGVTPRQAEILALLAEHMVPKEVASELDLSRYTVKSHLERVCRNLGVHSYKEAVREAKRRGIISS